MDRGRDHSRRQVSSESVRELASASARRHDVCGGASLTCAAGAQACGATRTPARHYRGTALAAADRQGTWPAETGTGHRPQSASSSSAAECTCPSGKWDSRRPAPGCRHYHSTRTRAPCGEILRQDCERNSFGSQCQCGGALHLDRSRDGKARTRSFQSSKAAHPRGLCRGYGLSAGLGSIFQRPAPPLLISPELAPRYVQESPPPAAARGELSPGAEDISRSRESVSIDERRPGAALDPAALYAANHRSY